MLLEFDIEYPRGSRRLGLGWDVMLMHHRGRSVRGVLYFERHSIGLERVCTVHH